MFGNTLSWLINCGKNPKGEGREHSFTKHGMLALLSISAKIKICVIYVRPATRSKFTARYTVPVNFMI